MKTFLVIAVAGLFFVVLITARATNSLSDAEIQGRSLAQQLCDGQPSEKISQTGVLKIKRPKAVETNFTIRCEGNITATNWSTLYSLNYPTNENVLATGANGLWPVVLDVSHSRNQPNEYMFNDGACMGIELKSSQAFIPFGDSDFWIADLGLEFFHWPAQKILPKTTNLKRGREYTLLESTNPNQTTNGYSRVLSWIDKETGGILQAEAYDPQGKLLKVFEPKSFKKVNGQWQLQEIQIENVQTGSRTRLEFDLNKR